MIARIITGTIQIIKKSKLEDNHPLTVSIFKIIFNYFNIKNFKIGRIKIEIQSIKVYILFIQYVFFTTLFNKYIILF